MNSNKAIVDFFERWEIDSSDLDFYVGKADKNSSSILSPFTRRAYYKIALLVDGEATVTYADKTILVSNNALVISNPLIPYAWQRTSANQSFYFCIFNEQFIGNQLIQHESTLKKAHILFPDEATRTKIITLFEMMITEAKGDYTLKYEVLRHYVQLLLHEAIKITPPPNSFSRTSSATRITTLFLELLSRQFPISAKHPQVHIRTAKGFAKQLSIHINTLNKAVKQTTGKTTSEHIADHLLKEAITLLRSTQLDIAEISHALGFEYPSNFNKFFRKGTGKAPGVFRKG